MGHHGRVVTSEQDPGQRRARGDDARVLRADHLEQLKKAQPRRVPVVTEIATHGLDEPPEGVLDMAADQIQIGGGDLRRHIARLLGGVVADLLRVHVPHPGEQFGLGETQLGLGVGRVVGEHVLVRLDGAA